MFDEDRRLLDTLLSAHLGSVSYHEVLRLITAMHPDVVFMLQVETWAPRRVSEGSVFLTDPAQMAAYEAVAHINPFLEVDALPSEERVFRTEDFISREEVRRSPFYEVFGRDFWDVTSAYALPIRFDRDGLAILSATMPDGLADSDRAALGMRLERLLRPVQHSFWLAGQMLSRGRMEGAGQSLDAMSVPAAVLDAEGRVRHANRLWNGASAGLRIGPDGRLGSSDGRTGAEVDAAVRQVVRMRRSMRLRIDLGAGPGAILSLVPVRSPKPTVLEEIVPLAPVILTTLVEPFDRKGSPRAILVDLFGLSSAEAELAVLIRQGHTLRQAADIRSVTYATARNQMASILAKLGLRGQSELTAFLARLSFAEE